MMITQCAWWLNVGFDSHSTDRGTPFTTPHKGKMYMESLLNCSAEILVIGFALFMVFNFVSGLMRLAAIARLTEQQSESHYIMPFKPILTSVTSQTEPEQAPQPQPLPLVIIGWDVVEPVGSAPATLRWLETAIKPDTINVTKQPNVIEIARVRQSKAQVLEVANQPERDLTRLGIRELKKLASAAKIKRYNVMTKIQLIGQLAALDRITA